ncbi:hypothetical protein ACFLZY_00780 [Patescibacteria group bacterium]
MEKRPIIRSEMDKTPEARETYGVEQDLIDELFLAGLIAKEAEEIKARWSSRVLSSLEQEAGQIWTELTTKAYQEVVEFDDRLRVDLVLGDQEC